MAEFAQADMRAAIPPPRPLPGDLAQQRPQHGVGVGAIASVALGAAMLSHDSAGPALTDTEAIPQQQDRSAPGGPGSEVSLRQLLQGLRLPRLIGDDPLQPRVLTLKLAQALGVIGLHPAVLIAPAVIRRLRDLQSLANLSDRAALAQHPIGFSQLADDLLGGMPASLHVIVPVSPMILDA